MAVGWFGGLGSILAIVFGNRARREIAAAPHRYSGEGLATAAIFFGWIGVIGTILAALVFFNIVAGFDPRGEGVPDAAVEEGGFRLNLESSLEDAAAAQRRYRSEHGTFATDLETLDPPRYQGVRLELVSAQPDAFCIQATHVDIAEIMHVTETRAIARRGACPSP